MKTYNMNSILVDFELVKRWVLENPYGIVQRWRLGGMIDDLVGILWGESETDSIGGIQVADEGPASIKNSGL